MKKIISSVLLILALFPAVSCRDTGADTPDSKEALNRKKYVNMFAFNMMNTYYLWNEEISEGLANWKYGEDPIEKVKSVRYKDASGKDIDRWTQLTDDFKAMSSGVSGTSTTPGFDFVLYYTDSSKKAVYMVVTLVYADSPAAEAGLKRGDVIVKLNGKTIDGDKYSEIIMDNLYSGTSCSLTLYGGSEVTVRRVEMYEDPVLLFKTFAFGGKKVGYFLYNAFTQGSYLRIIEACKYFKAEGIDELILDLRYNGGGFTLTEQALASMLAPEAEVKAGSIFETQVYNKKVTEEMGREETPFTTGFTFTDKGKSVSFSTADANIGIKKIYALVSSGTASASESLICCLKPYMDVEVLGTQTHGKYCSGIMCSAKTWYDDVRKDLGDEDYNKGIKYSDNWGIYVMIGRFADKNGVTLCMPSGLVPDIEVADDPLDGFQFGDPSEKMLGAALSRAGYVPVTSSSAKAEREERPIRIDEPLPFSMQFHRPGFGTKIEEISF